MNELAARAGVSGQAVRKLLDAGRLAGEKTVTDGRVAWQIPVEAAQAYLDARAARAAATTPATTPAGPATGGAPARQPRQGPTTPPRPVPARSAPSPASSLEQEVEYLRGELARVREHRDAVLAAHRALLDALTAT